MSDAGRRLECIQDKYPYRVTVPGYYAKMKAGEIPSLVDLESLGCKFGSWVVKARTDAFAVDRVFGFRTHDELLAFKRAYKLGDGA